jgi:molybdate/tungstate transport system substrate-binding protein
MLNIGNNYLEMNLKHDTLLLIIFVIIGLYSTHLLEGFPIAKGTILTDKQDKVFVMYAGSLVKIFEDIIGPAFQNESGYPYVGEGKGSVQVSNLIIDGFRTPDVFVSAGSVPMIKLMNTTPPIVDWFLKFGSAEIVIAYSSNSPHFDDLEKARKGEIPWFDVVSQNGFKFGRTDPELDPKGYYGIIAAELANSYYNDSSIKNRVFGEDRNPKQIFPEETLKTVLEAGTLDAVLAYKHEAISRGLPYITLPKEINLGDPNYSDLYKRANYTLQSGQKTIYGEPVEFAVTIPNTVKNIEGATSFVNFLISMNGSQLLKGQGLNPINVTAEGNADDIPTSIREAIQ